MTERERLAELIQSAMYWGYTTPSEIAERLIEDGDVIVPPCKVGDMVYVVSQTKDKRILPFVNEYEVTSIKVGKRKCTIYHEMDGYIKIFKQDDFGKTVYLTREEAEATLAGRRRTQ